MHGFTLPVLYLKRGKEGPIVAGHPWIYSGALDKNRIPSDLQPGCWVRIANHRGDPLAVGLYSPHSTIRVRTLGRDFAPPADLDPASRADGVVFWSSCVQRALDKRAKLGLPEEGTDAVRLINSEGDGLPGLIVDRFGPALVVQVTTLPMARRRDLIEEALEHCVGACPILRADPKTSAEQEGFEPLRGWRSGEGPEQVRFRENGIVYTLSEQSLQKTGHYLDVREHRRWIGALAADRSVFDGFAFTGGFALNALKGGATSVVAVDSSAPALELARGNAAPLDPDGRATFVQSDVRNQLRSCYDRGQKFDIVVLDPPKYAPNKRNQNAAAKAYTSLAVEALRILEPGGLLGLSSCSHHIGESELRHALALACGRVGRDLEIVKVGGQPPDHAYPVAMGEGRYLTFVFAIDRMPL